MKESDIRKRKALGKYLKLVKEDVKCFLKNSDFIDIQCPACDSSQYEKKFEKYGFSYVVCKKCETLFTNPRPSMEAMKKFYVHSSSSEFWTEKFFKPVAEARRKQIFKPRAEHVSNILNQLENKTVGDVGAGFGLFLEELRKMNRKIRCIAVEPSPKMAQTCRAKEFEVIPDMLENVDDGYKNSFFLLTAFELFEHLVNPSVFLEKIFFLLRPGGYLYLTALNGRGFDIQILWERSNSIFPPIHLNFFNPASIRILLEKIGFEIQEVSTPGKLDWNIVEGMIKEEQLDAGRFWNLLAKNGSEECKKTLQDWIVKNNLSSHMRVVAKKPETERVF